MMVNYLQRKANLITLNISRNNLGVSLFVGHALFQMNYLVNIG